jgi:hypothetical protein
MRLVIFLLLLATGAIQAEPYRVSDKATLRLVAVKDGFKATLTNTHTRPLAVLPLSSGWCHHWDVKVRDGSGQEYGLLVPPGPAFMPTPDGFRVLKPKEALTATFAFSSFLRVNRQTDTVEKLKSPASVSVAYTFDPGPGLRAAPRSSQEQPGFGKEWTKLFSQADFLKPLLTSLKL